MIERCRRIGLNQINANALGLKDSSDISEIELYSLVEWLTGKSAEIAELGIVVQTNRSPIGYYTGPIHSEIQVIPGEDWFDVKAVVRFGELKIPFVKLRKYILNGIREFPLPGGLVAVLPGMGIFSIFLRIRTTG
jgi:hypothetical protein